MTREDFFDALFGDNEEWKCITEEKIDEQTRWSVYKSQVMQRVEDGKYFEFWWGEGATEMQEGQDEPYGFFEVEPKEVTITQYETVLNGKTKEFD